MVAEKLPGLIRLLNCVPSVRDNLSCNVPNRSRDGVQSYCRVTSGQRRRAKMRDQYASMKESCVPPPSSCPENPIVGSSRLRYTPIQNLLLVTSGQDKLDCSQDRCWVQPTRVLAATNTCLGRNHYISCRWPTTSSKTMLMASNTNWLWLWLWLWL